MMNMQKVFNYEGARVRTVMIDGEPWFVAKDVCFILELQNPTVVIQRLDEDERAKFNLGRQGETNIVNEAGLYNLIFASRKPEAKAFKRWVTHEVLPTIRQTGSYSIFYDLIPKTLPEALHKYAEALEENGRLTEKINTLTDQIETDAPKVEAFNNFIESHAWQTVAEVAKSLNDGRNRIYQILREDGILIKSGMDKNLPLQKYIERGYFSVKEYTFWKDGQLMTRSRTLVSPTGVEFIRNILKHRKLAS
ncbi:phage antirepressor KilAC domain-containing protein [Heliobacterium chlorum]|uniref:Phage antirepressor KilAC domain-containing protein n=1 Tax=Heliobacterium chlorum TaxID=2698 RepID=A0ABR7T9C7_HELCL|nr:phage antirepressor [Heliobacterium chlorum]MBC9786446.1 phage antirepressor KilAC domain-containing protein [Heliobacterium chlorum]